MYRAALSRVWLMVSLVLGVVACGPAAQTPASPSPTATYSGEWRGTTSQGEPITFVVSPDSKVVMIAANYRFNGCSGATRADGLALDIAIPDRPPENPGAGPFANPGFTYLSAQTMGDDFYSVTGAFASTETAIGVIGFNEFKGCGFAIASWNARKQ